MRNAHLILPTVLCGIIGVSLLAAVPQAAPAPKPNASDDRQLVTYDFGAAEWLNAPHTIAASKGVTFEQGDAVLKTEAAVANFDDKQRLLNAESKGPVHLYDAQNDLTGKQGFVDFTRHLAKLQTDIILIVKPGSAETNAPEGTLRSRFKDAATMTCQALTYDYRRKFGRVPGPLTVRQVIPRKTGPLTRTLTADAGEYDGRAETVTLTGNVQGRDSDGNIIQASTKGREPVTIGLKEGAEFLKIPFPLHGMVKPGVANDANDGEAPSDVPPPPLTNRPANSPDNGPLAPSSGGTGKDALPSGSPRTGGRGDNAGANP